MTKCKDFESAVTFLCAVCMNHKYVNDKHGEGYNHACKKGHNCYDIMMNEVP